MLTFPQVRGLIDYTIMTLMVCAHQGVATHQAVRSRRMRKIIGHYATMSASMANRGSISALSAIGSCLRCSAVAPMRAMTPSKTL